MDVMNGKTKVEKTVIALCLGILSFFMVTIALRFTTRKIVIGFFDIDNIFTKLIWFDNLGKRHYGDNDNNETNNEELIYDWEKLYPFEEGTHHLNIDLQEEPQVIEEQPIAKHSMFNTIKAAMQHVKDRIESYTTNLLIFYKHLIEAAYKYEGFIKWNFAPYDEYNPVVELSDNYFVSYMELRDITSQYDALCEFNEYCHAHNIDFMFIPAPYKICKYEDPEISGVIDFSNQTADNLLERLLKANVDYYDIRETIHEQGLNHHSLFYDTDHHWRTTTGLWAAQNILEQCNKTYHWKVDTTKLNKDKFDIVTYRKWFLGSHGKKVTLAKATPDDFSLLYPKYTTLFHYIVYSMGINTVGNYAVTYFMDGLGHKDYYNENPYGVCNYSDNPLTEIKNLLDGEDKKIVVIHDSFFNCVVPALALCVKTVNSVDLRHFTGSVRSYLQKTKPDLVIVSRNAADIGGKINYSTHTDTFDFR